MKAGLGYISLVIFLVKLFYPCCPREAENPNSQVFGVSCRNINRGGSMQQPHQQRMKHEHFHRTTVYAFSFFSPSLPPYLSGFCSSCLI